MRRTFSIELNITYDTEKISKNGVGDLIKDINSGAFQRGLKKENGVIKLSAKAREIKN